MHHAKILIGGIYLVRFTAGINARAEVIRALPQEEVEKYRSKRYPAGFKAEVSYECRLVQSVGEYRKGHVFVVRARSVKEMVEAPPGDRRETAKTPNDLRHLKHPEASPAPPATTGEGFVAPPSFFDMAQRAKAAQQEADKLSLLMRVNIDLTLPLSEVAALLCKLEEYQPYLHVARPVHPLPTD